MRLQPGSVIAGKYSVTGVLGEGGMGTVYQGRHIEIGYTVAIKVLREDHLGDNDSVSRFHAEARAVAKLRTKHVAKVFDVGTLENGLPFLVMEFLEGGDLEAELTRRGRFPAAEAGQYVIAACAAMSEAHAAGVIHRDLKPANLFLAREGNDTVVKVVDFGISRVLPENGVRLTQTQSAFGTPLYMAPESVRSAKLADERTDVWALGVILYELVTGTLPFLGETPTAVAVAVTLDEVKPPSLVVDGVPQWVDAVVKRSLEKNPNSRFQTAQELAQAIEAGISGSQPERSSVVAVAAKVASAEESVGPAVRDARVSGTSTRTAVWLGVGMALLGVVVGALFYLRTNDAGSRPVASEAPSALPQVESGAPVDPTNPTPKVEPAQLPVDATATSRVAVIATASTSAAPSAAPSVPPTSLPSAAPSAVQPTAAPAPTVTSPPTATAKPAVSSKGNPLRL
jgi:serine/threonine-protein kinase